MNEKKNDFLFEEDGEISSSVLKEESDLLFSPAAENSKERSPERESVELSRSEMRAEIETEIETETETEETSPLIERIRRELALKRREDAVQPSTRRPRLEKKAERAGVPLVSVRSSKKNTDVAVKKVPGSKNTFEAPFSSPLREKRAPSSTDKKKDSSSGGLSRIPVLGYCIDLFAALFRLPSSIREINARSLKKEMVVQTRLDGLGNRLASLREGVEHCRSDMESGLAEKTDAISRLGDELALKVDGKRFESFTLNLESELARKADGRSLEALQNSWEIGLRELRAEIAEKAGKDRLDAVEKGLRTKTDTEVARSLGEDLKEVKERLYSLGEEKAGKERLQSLASRLDEELERIEFRLSSKADVDALEALEKRLGGISGELSAALTEKADAKSVEELASTLESKPSAERLEALASELALKADALRVGVLESLVALKPDAASMEALIAAKADVDAVKALAERLEEVNERLDTKADTEVLEALDASERRLEGIAGDMLVSISLKADAERVEALESLIASKGDAASMELLIESKIDSDAVRLLEERLEEVGERTNGFDGKAALERLESLESRLDLKADLELVKSLLSLKVDVEVLKSLGKSLEEAEGEMRAALESKADAAILNTLSESLAGITERLGALDSKADSASLLSLVQRLEALSEELGELDMKTEALFAQALGEKLEALSERLNTLDEKADREQVESVLVRKADAEALASLAKEMNGRLAAKADSSAVDRALAAKAEKMDVEGFQKTVDGELNELQRRIDQRNELAGEEERRLARFRDEVKALIASSLERGMRAEIEERYRANFPYVRKMKERSVAFQRLDSIDSMKKAASETPEGSKSKDAKSRKRVKR